VEQLVRGLLGTFRRTRADATNGMSAFTSRAIRTSAERTRVPSSPGRHDRHRARVRESLWSAGVILGQHVDAVRVSGGLRLEGNVERQGDRPARRAVDGAFGQIDGRRIRLEPVRAARGKGRPERSRGRMEEAERAGTAVDLLEAEDQGDVLLVSDQELEIVEGPPALALRHGPRECVRHVIAHGYGRVGRRHAEGAERLSRKGQGQLERPDVAARYPVAVSVRWPDDAALVKPSASVAGIDGRAGRQVDAYLAEVDDRAREAALEQGVSERRATTVRQADREATVVRDRRRDRADRATPVAVQRLWRRRPANGGTAARAASLH